MQKVGYDVETITTTTTITTSDTPEEPMYAYPGMTCSEAMMRSNAAVGNNAAVAAIAADNSSSGGSELSSGAIAGIAIGTTAGVVLFAAGAMFAIRGSRKRAASLSSTRP